MARRTIDRSRVSRDFAQIIGGYPITTADVLECDTEPRTMEAAQLDDTLASPGLTERVEALLGLLPAGMLLKLAVVSAIALVGTMIAIPFILVRLPEDYFDVRVPRNWMDNRHPFIRTSGQVVKNIAGIVFLLAGLSMLVLPGQGLLTILIGVSLLDFPGKRRLEAWIIGRPMMFNAVNALRAKFGKPALILAPREESGS